MILSLIVFIVLSLIVHIVIAYGNDDYSSLIPTLILTLLAVLFMFMFHNEGKNDGYKMGQVDYHNGIIRYEFEKKVSDSLDYESWRLK